jgi:hypothetical protein
MVLDISRAFLYYDQDIGRIAEVPKRPVRHFAIVDGLIGGHRESPLAPTPYPSGLMIAGANPVAVDSVAAALMGFDWRRIPQVARAYEPHRYPLVTFRAEDVRIRGLASAENLSQVYDSGTYERFEPSRGFRGKIEWGSDLRESAFPTERGPAAPLDLPAA